MPGPPSCGKMNQLRPSRDGETLRGEKEESTPDAMKKDPAANRVIRLLLPVLHNTEEVTHSAPA